MFPIIGLLLIPRANTHIFDHTITFVKNVCTRVLIVWNPMVRYVYVKGKTQLSIDKHKITTVESVISRIENFINSSNLI